MHQSTTSSQRHDQKRVIYETSADRSRQREAIHYLAKATATIGVETKRLAGWDYEMVRGQRTFALVEVKCRNCSFQTYPTYMVSEAKALNLRDQAIRMGIAGGLLVNWKDAIGWLRVDVLHPDTWRVEMGGRIDRNDPMDIERVVHFRISDFRFIDQETGAFR